MIASGDRLWAQWFPILWRVRASGPGWWWNHSVLDMTDDIYSNLFSEGTGIRTQRQVMSSQILFPSAHVSNPFLYAPVLQSCTLPMTAWMDAVTWHFRSQILCWRRFKVALLRDQSGDPGYGTKGMAVIHARLIRLCGLKAWSPIRNLLSRLFEHVMSKTGNCQRVLWRCLWPSCPGLVVMISMRAINTDTPAAPKSHPSQERLERQGSFNHGQGSFNHGQGSFKDGPWDFLLKWTLMVRKTYHSCTVCRE